MRAEPRRTCLGCRQVRPKAALIRLVRGSDGRVRLDPRSRAAGRGAYACPTLECLERALVAGRLSHALRQACQPPSESAHAILQHWRR